MVPGPVRVKEINSSAFGCQRPCSSNPRVPAGVFLRRVIDPHGQHVAGPGARVSAGLQSRGEIDKEAREAVGVRRELLPVGRDLGVHVNALELGAHALALPVCRGLPVEAIPADAGGQKAALATHGCFRVHLALDAPVVRQGDGAPEGIGEVRARGVLWIAQKELPVVVEAQVLARRLRGGVSGEGEGKG